MGGKNGRVGRHDQECTPRNSLNVAAKTEDETRDKIYNAGGIRIIHILEIDDYRNFLTKILTDGSGISEVSRAHYCDLDGVTHGKLATRGFIVVLNLTDVLGSIPVIIMLHETEPITGVAWHCADLRCCEPIHGHRQARLWLMTETAVN
jgi:hypothetical protein